MTLLLVTTPGSVDARGRDFWNRSGTEALQEGREKRLWVLVYFPAAGQERDHPEGRKFAVPTKLSEELIGARVRAAELTALREIFELTDRDAVDILPALFLVAPHGKLIHGWTRRWQSQDVLGKFQSGRRALRRTYKWIERRLGRAERTLKLGRSSEAIKLLEEGRSKMRPGFPQEARVKDLADRLRARANNALLETLAREGLVTDAGLLRGLDQLVTTYPLEEFVARVEREKKRIHERTVGGE